jgi:hypothetical protein
MRMTAHNEFGYHLLKTLQAVLRLDGHWGNIIRVGWIDTIRAANLQFIDNFRKRWILIQEFQWVIHPKLDTSWTARLFPRGPGTVGLESHLLLLLECNAIQVIIHSGGVRQCRVNCICLDTLCSILFGSISNFEVKIVDYLDRLMRHALSWVCLINFVREHLYFNSYWSPIFVLLKSQVELIDLRGVDIEGCCWHIVVPIVTVPRKGIISLCVEYSRCITR